jgi:hypothetical protein
MEEIPMSSAIPDPLTVDAGSGHTRWVRISHWIVAASVLTLALTGFVILMAHPRLYWGAVGNDLTPALFELPISRNHKHGGWEKSVAFFPDAGSPVTASRTYDIFNENRGGACIFWRPGSSWQPERTMFLQGSSPVTSGVICCPTAPNSHCGASGRI